MNVHIYSEEDAAQWDRWYQRLDAGGPYHKSTHLQLLAGNFEDSDAVAELFVLEAGDEFVYYPYLRRPLRNLSFAAQADEVDIEAYDDIVSSWYYGGPLASTPDDEALAERFASQFGTYCAESGIVSEFVRFDPNLRNHETFEHYDPTLNRETIPVDLSGGPAAIWEGYEDRNQRAIRQAQETDLRVEPATESHDYRAFHRIYAAAMDAKDASEHYRFDREFFTQRVRDTESMTLLVARHEGDVVGGFVTAHDVDIGCHFLSASIPDYWDMRVNNLLFHEAVMDMCERGRHTFDFQGGRPGVFKFKKGFSPLRREFFIGSRIHLPEVYDTLVEAAVDAGRTVDEDYFPRYRRSQSN